MQPRKQLLLSAKTSSQKFVEFFEEFDKLNLSICASKKTNEEKQINKIIDFLYDILQVSHLHLSFTVKKH